MDTSADLKEVFKRLAERAAPFLDERHQEMPLPEKFEPSHLQKERK